MLATEPFFGFGAPSGVADLAGLARSTELADREGLDHFSLMDHPYLGDHLDAYATLATVLGRTRRLTGVVNVSNLPIRTAPVLARTVTSLSALTGGRVVLGLGAGGNWDRIADLGVPRLAPAAAVAAFEEAIVVVRALAGGGPPVTYDGTHHHLHGIDPSPVAAPPIWTGSVGTRSLAVTGRLADGWIPGHASDWRSERYRTSRPVVDEAAASAGRDPREVRTVFNLPGRITDRPTATRDRTGRWLGGSPAQWIDELVHAVVDHDAAGFTLFSPSGGAPDETALARWATEVAPAVREAVRDERRSA